ncbi:tetratricopeptide repeat protein, partial [Pelagibacterales bacterium SAG-MED23]|nr:tetratricopeptide repeat protein [Pelagibacterales bacterium SAG-MED23]
MNSNIFDEKKIKILELFKKKKFQEAIDAGNKLLREKNDDTQLINLLVTASINLQKFTDAEKYIKELLNLKKTDQIFNICGNIQKKLKKYNQAIISYEKAISLNPNFSEAYNNLGNTKKIINEREQAVSCYKKAVDLKADNFQALFNLSNIYKEDNNYKDLIGVYDKILDLDKNNIKTLYNLGSAHLFLGNISKGKEYFKRVFEIDKSHIPS